MLQERARKNQARAGGDKKSAGSLSTKSSTNLDDKINTRKVAAAIADTAAATVRYERMTLCYRNIGEYIKAEKMYEILPIPYFSHRPVLTRGNHIPVNLAP